MEGKSEARRAFSRAALALALMETVAQGIGLVLSYVLCPLLPRWVVSSLWFQWAAGVLPLYLAAMPAAYLLLRGMPVSRPPEAPLPLWQGLIGFLSGYGLMMAGSLSGLGITVLVQLLSGTSGGGSAASRITASSPWWYNLAVVAVLAPIMEELFFRRLLLDRLRSRGDGPALLFTAVAFGLIHGNFQQFLAAGAFGLVLGWVYLKTGRLRYSILLHGAVNLLGGVIMPAALASGSTLALLSAAGVAFALAAAGAVLLILYVRPAVGALSVPGEASAPGCIRHAFLNVGFGVLLAVMAAIFVLGFLL